MKPSLILRGGGMEHPRRFPFPRRILYITPTYWQGSKYGVRNSIVVAFLFGVFMWKVVLPIESYYVVHLQAPNKPTYYMRWNRQYKDDPYGEKMFAGKERYKPMKDEH